MNIRYLVKIGTNPARIFFEFHPKTKIILGARIEADHIEVNQVKWIMTNAPTSESDLLQNFAALTGKKCQIMFTPERITFEMFWDKYRAKVGNKPRAKKLWDLLNDVEQVDAFTGIDKYNAYLIQNPSLTKAYPETYLSQQRWKN